MFTIHSAFWIGLTIGVARAIFRLTVIVLFDIAVWSLFAYLVRWPVNRKNRATDTRTN